MLWKPSSSSGNSLSQEDSPPISFVGVDQQVTLLGSVVTLLLRKVCQSPAL